MESNFIKKPINGFVNIKERIPAFFFLDQKAPEVSPVKMSNLALKNGRTSPRRITGNDSQRAPRGHSAVPRGPLRSNARLLTNLLREASAPPTEEVGVAVFFRLGLSEGPRDAGALVVRLRVFYKVWHLEENSPRNNAKLTTQHCQSRGSYLCWTCSGSHLDLI